MGEVNARADNIVWTLLLLQWEKAKIIPPNRKRANRSQGRESAG